MSVRYQPAAPPTQPPPTLRVPPLHSLQLGFARQIQAAGSRGPRLAQRRLEARDRRAPPLPSQIRLGAPIPARSHARGKRRASATRTARDRREALRSEEHTSELQSRLPLVCRLLLET